LGSTQWKGLEVIIPGAGSEQILGRMPVDVLPLGLIVWLTPCSTPLKMYSPFGEVSKVKNFFLSSCYTLLSPTCGFNSWCAKRCLAQEDVLAQEMTHDLEMIFYKIAPFGKEDTVKLNVRFPCVDPPSCSNV
jgi:hypothetical protein